MIERGKFYLFVMNVSDLQTLWVFFHIQCNFFLKAWVGSDLIKFFFDLCVSWVAANSCHCPFSLWEGGYSVFARVLICCPDARGSVGQLLTEAILWGPHLLFIGCSSLLEKHMVCGYGYFCLLKFIPHRCNSENLKVPLLFVTAKSFPLLVLTPLFHQQNLCLNSCNLAFLQFAWMQHCSPIVFAMYGCCMWWWLTFGTHLEYLGDLDLGGIALCCVMGTGVKCDLKWKPWFPLLGKASAELDLGLMYWSLSQHPVLLYAAL